MIDFAFTVNCESFFMNFSSKYTSILLLKIDIGLLFHGKRNLYDIDRKALIKEFLAFGQMKINL